MTPAHHVAGVFCFALFIVMSNFDRTGWRGATVVILPIGAALATACVHYDAKPIGPTQRLTTIESRTTDDGRLWGAGQTTRGE